MIDDVWDAEHLKPFLRGADLSALLITTRNGRIATRLADMPGRINVAELEIGEAEQLLMARLPNRPDNVAPFCTLARRLGEFPLLLDSSPISLVFGVWVLSGFAQMETELTKSA